MNVEILQKVIATPKKTSSEPEAKLRSSLVLAGLYNGAEAPTPSMYAYSAEHKQDNLIIRVWTDSFTRYEYREIDFDEKKLEETIKKHIGYFQKITCGIIESDTAEYYISISVDKRMIAYIGREAVEIKPNAELDEPKTLKQIRNIDVATDWPKTISSEIIKSAKTALAGQMTT